MEREVFLEPDDLIISKTDLKGKITYVNRTFMKISKFYEKDVLGKPHNIIRHSDMPRGTFKLLWDTLHRGEEWFGFVKNRTADGNYYWVFANVNKGFEYGKHVGYYSVRRAAPRHAVALMSELYAKMRAVESRHSDSRAPQASLDMLMEHVRNEGMTYEKFVLNLFDQG